MTKCKQVIGIITSTHLIVIIIAKIYKQFHAQLIMPAVLVDRYIVT